MKSTALKISAFVLTLACSAGVLAASQGTAGATSTGSYTNTLGTVAPPQVRVFGLLDANLTATSSTVTTPWGMQPGVSDQFCVAHSTGGNVRITFSSPGISAGGMNIQAKSATTGATKAYHQLIYRTGTVPTDANAIRSTTLSFDITSAQSDLVNCVNPNVTKTILLQGGATWAASETDVFTDTVTVTASPI